MNAARSPERRPDPLAQRRRAVHAACRAVNMTTEDRHALQQEVTGKSSLTDMDARDLDRLLNRLNRGTRVAAHRPHAAKIKALWWSLYWLGEVKRPDPGALDAFVRRQAGVDALRFLDHRQAFAVIEALKGMAARAGVRWWAAGDGDDLADRRAVLDAIGRRLMSRNAALPARPAPTWSRDDYDAEIRVAGKRLRAAMAPGA